MGKIFLLFLVVCSFEIYIYMDLSLVVLLSVLSLLHAWLFFRFFFFWDIQSNLKEYRERLYIYDVFLFFLLLLFSYLKRKQDQMKGNFISFICLSYYLVPILFNSSIKLVVLGRFQIHVFFFFVKIIYVLTNQI